MASISPLFSDHIKSKIKDYSKIALVIAAFLAAYFNVHNGPVRQVFIYFLLLIGMHFGYNMPESAVIINTLGLVLLFATAGPHWLGPTLGLMLLLIASTIVPFYYYWFYRLEQDDFWIRRNNRTRKIVELENNLHELEKERGTLEIEIEKINKLYVLGRDLVERTDLKEVLENLMRVMLNRSGIKSAVIFGWGNNTWEVLQLSRPELQKKWLKFIWQLRSLHQEKDCVLLDAPEWLEKESVIFWPVRLDKELLAAVVLTAEPPMAQRYVEEGAIFVPQIALGLKRTRLFAEVQERSRKDGLTELYLRRYFLERLQTEIKRAKRYSSAFSLLMIDLDHFKKVNDTWGHIAGDEVLQSFARLLQHATRPGDLVGRYGGEEFIVLLPLAKKAESMEIAEKIKRAVEQKEMSAGQSKFNITVSIGVSHYPLDGESAEELLSKADQALYWVKTHGRNGVREFSEMFRK